MKITRFVEEYSQQKVEVIRRLLEKQAEKGTPMAYEISVDNFKVVMKTTDVSDFDSYEDVMDKDSKTVRITTFETPEENASQIRFVFDLTNNKPEGTTTLMHQGLGEVEVNNRIKESLAVERERWDKDLLIKELEKTKNLLQESEEYSDSLQAGIDRLKEEIERTKQKPNYLGRLDLGMLASSILEGVVRGNPQWLNKVPGLQNLSGMIEKKNEGGEETKNVPAEDTEVSFKKSENAAPPLSDEDLRCLKLGRRIADLFEDEEMELLVNIIEELGDDTSQLQTVADLLDVSKEETGKN